MPSDDELERVRAERDLYRALLELGAHDDVAPFLDEALGLVAGVTGAHRGYLALHAAATGERAGEPSFWVARGFTDRDVDEVRRQISGGIVAEALRTGRTVSTASAVADPRFSAQKSVQAQRIQAVLCAPVGGAERPAGVLYLQGRDAPGPFPERDRALAETFARRMGPLAEKLLRAEKHARREDPTLALRAKLRVEGIAGTSPALAEVFRQLAVAAAVDVTVLFTGESGTGKTEVARALHRSSRRARGPFVEINCAALPEGLFEAELFGAEKGAHSTATQRMPGKVSAAQGGTLFLDEVGEIPLTSQAKLLQFLQSKKYFRLGGDSPVEADVRVVAATNADLERSVREKRFREDLYYRLNVLTVRVPALRERPSDVVVIAEELTRAAGESMGRPMRLSWETRAALANAEWPGNVRQLSAAIQRGAAFALSEASETIEPRHLFPPLPGGPGASGEEKTAGEALSWQDATRRFQKRLLQDALDAAKGNVTEAARRLGLARSHLHELIRAHGVSVSRERG